MGVHGGIHSNIAYIIKNWPLDRNKIGRDLGEYLQRNLDRLFINPTIKLTPKELDREYLALKSILTDVSKKKYPRTCNTTASGLKFHECNRALSNEMLQQFESNKGSIFRQATHIEDVLRPNKQS